MQATPVISIACLPYLSPEECNALLEEIDVDGWKSGRLVMPGDAADVSRDIRGCEITDRLPTSWIERITADVLRINTEHFGFDISGLEDADPICAMRYGVGDHFDWHVDNSVSSAPYGTRKLAFSIQLTPPDAYQGGDLEFGMYSPAYNPGALDEQRVTSRRQGMLIMFAAFQLHRVAPVTQGVRTALVGWLHGPAFR